MDLIRPIRSIDLPGVANLALQGLIVVVGPNSSGKTQLLRDINEIICGRRRELVVASTVSFDTLPPFEEHWDSLIDRGSIQEEESGHFSRRSLQHGAEDGAGGTFGKPRVEKAYTQLAGSTQQKAEGPLPVNSFLKELGPFLCSALFLENRLTLMNNCRNFPYHEQGPSLTLQALHWNKEAKAALNKEIVTVFRRAVWVDDKRHPDLVLRASDSPCIPTAEDRLEPEEMDKYRTIETEGDGLRSYSAICATLLLEERPLCLVDEPEMCLHPPQAYAIGRFIGLHASSETCTIVATHSSHVLKGILETDPEVHVIRLTRAASTFQARDLPGEILEQVISKPRSRSEAVLDGLLSHAVVLCEGEGDRLVYESTYRTLADRELDIRFIPSGGTGGFTDPLRLYQAIGIPSAVIADLDFLANNGTLKNVLTGLGTPTGEVTELCRRAREAIASIKSVISQINPQELQEELQELCQEPIDLEKNEDDPLRGKLSRIVGRLHRLRALKQRGLDAIPEECKDGDTVVLLRGDVRSLLDNLQSHGLFLVPGGELESWLPVLMDGIDDNDKSRWAMRAAGIIEDVGPRNNDVWQFMQSVYSYLDNQFGRDAGMNSTAASESG